MNNIHKVTLDGSRAFCRSGGKVASFYNAKYPSVKMLEIKRARKTIKSLLYNTSLLIFAFF